MSKKFKPNKEVISWSEKNKGKINIYHDPKKAVSGADVIFSDKVISLNDKVDKKKIKEFKKFKINKKLISYAKKIVFFYIVYQEATKLTMKFF